MLQAARADLISEFGHEGVDHVEYVAALPNREVWVWLGTATDEQRDDLAPSTDLMERVTTVLAEAALAGVHVPGVTIQSAETVDREYQGSWFYALR